MKKKEEIKSKSHYEKQFEQELARLNSEQRRAVEHIEGPVMVIAGPGTGKTQILAARIGHILKSDLQAGPHNILCLTYTDAGAIAMRKRLLQFIGPTAYRVNIHTFHSFCNDIIQHNPDYFGRKEMLPVSELENTQCLREMIDGLENNHPLKRLKGDFYFESKRLNSLFRMMKEENWTAEFVSERIDAYLRDLPQRDEYIYKKANQTKGIKVGDIKRKAFDKEASRMENLRAAAALLPRYNALLQEKQRYDFSDMLLWVLNAFKTDENFLRRYQEWYQYFLVDEFQDTSGAQNEILRHLIDFWEKPNVFVVGDDDQCIYEFQGARVHNMMQFYERYQEDIEVIVLKENYRSTQKILDASAAVIGNNLQRLINQENIKKKIPLLNKNLIASNPLLEKTQVVPRLIEYYNARHEEDAIADQIEALYRQGENLADAAVIYHQHDHADNLISILEKKQIPYNVKKRLNALEQPEIQRILNILSYLKEELEKPHSGEHRLFGLMHARCFNIHPRDSAKIAVQCYKERARWRDFLGHYNNLKNLVLENYGGVIFFEENINRWITEAANSTLTQLIQHILNFSGMLREAMNAPDKIWQLQLLSTFFEFAKQEAERNPFLSLEKFLETVQQMREEEISLPVDKNIHAENGINLITAHSAKGLEFKYVFIMRCNADAWEKARGGQGGYALPDTLTFDSEEQSKIESLRRLFYVGMTRAKEHLQISYAGYSSDGKEVAASQFINEVHALTQLPIEKVHLSPDKITDYSALLLSETPVNLTQAALLEKQHIAEILSGFSMTASNLNQYIACPLGFYYQYILRVPSAGNQYSAFGTAAHNALKWLFDEMKKNNSTFPSEKDFTEQFKKQMARQRGGITQQEYKNLLAYGEEILPEYYRHYAEKWNKIVLTEFQVNQIEIDGVPVRGKIDKIEFILTDATVVDYKTGQSPDRMKKLSPPSEKNPEGGEYWRQLIFYKLMLDNYRRKDWKVTVGEIDFIEKDKDKNQFIKARVEFLPAHLETVKLQLKEAYMKIMNHEFTRGCGEKDCEWCSFAKENAAEVRLEKKEEVQQ